MAPPPQYPLEPFGAGYEVAIEILREFGATELVGRLFTRPKGGSWLPTPLSVAQQLPWYEFFVKNPALVVFDMQGSGVWELVYVRLESDEQGQYTAIALRLPAKRPAWVDIVRRRVAEW